MLTSALGLIAVDMEGQEDPRRLWKTESMGMGDMEDEEGKMKLLLDLLSLWMSSYFLFLLFTLNDLCFCFLELHDWKKTKVNKKDQ